MKTESVDQDFNAVEDGCYYIKGQVLIFYQIHKPIIDDVKIVL